MLDPLAGQVMLQSGWNAFEVLVPLGKHPGLHHHLPQMLESGTGRQLVQEVVADRAAFGDELGQDLGVRVLVNPLDGFERRVSAGEAIGEWLELHRDGPVWAGEQVVDLVGEDPVGASAVPVGGSGPSALAAAVVDIVTGAAATAPIQTSEVAPLPDARVGRGAVRSAARGGSASIEGLIPPVPSPSGEPTR